MADPGTPRKSRGGIFFLIIILLVLLNVVMWYFNVNSRKEVEVKDTALAQKEDELKVARVQLDSIKSVLNDKIAEVAKLGGDTTELHNMMRKLERDLKSARGARTGDIRKIKELAERVEEYEEELGKRDEEIAKLKAERDQMFEDNKSLKTNMAAREDSIAAMSRHTKDLADKVATAAILRAENVKVSTIDAKGKEHGGEASYRAKKVDKIKVSFNLAENKLAKVENKDVYLVVQAPDGTTLSDLSLGGGSFSADGKELQYTSKQSVLYEYTKPGVVFVYGKGSPLAAGGYNVEIYCEGTKIGTGSFAIK
ncbi:MAG: hypothetical protein V4543_09300 [Bacteroidota bacterium]